VSNRNCLLKRLLLAGYWWIVGIICWIPCVFNNSVYAQNDPETDSVQIQVVNTDLLVIEKNETTDWRRLIGNVVLSQDTATLYCDSAYFYSDRNYVEAMSNVKIEMANGVTIVAKRLTYDGKTRIVELYENIVLTHKADTLTTNRLTYYRNLDKALYFNKGRLSDAENVLTSQTGVYYNFNDQAHFEGNVVLLNKKYRLETPVIDYSTKSKRADFLAPTFIYSTKGDTLYTERGYFKTAEKEFFVYQHPYFKDSSYVLSGDTLYYDDSVGRGWAHCSVKMRSRDSSLMIVGDWGKIVRSTRELRIYDDAYLRYHLKEDTLVLFGDTLYSIDDSTTATRQLKAFRNVSFTMRQMQGVCDSMAYNRIDSTLHLIRDPVVWTQSNQLTGDTIRLWMKNRTIDSLRVIGNAFAIAKEDTMFYNQMKGKLLVAFFRDKAIHRVDVRGNAESMYVVKDGPRYVGLNHSFSKGLKVYLADNQPQKIVFTQNPTATFYPIFLIWNAENRLPGFRLRDERRPAYYYFPERYRERVAKQP
jgi:lipopolysaccharide export system protein LptA